MQQINLYQPILRKQQKVFSAKTLLLGNLLVLVALLLLYGYTHWQTRNLQQQWEQVQAQRADRITRLQQLQAQFPPPQADANLPTEIDATRALLRERQALLRAIERQQTGVEQRFSAQLLGLAQQVKGPLWLEQIRLAPRQVQLHGFSTEAKGIPGLIQSLSKEAAFAGLSFEQVVIEREAESGLLRFTLNSQREGGP